MAQFIYDNLISLPAGLEPFIRIVLPATALPAGVPALVLPVLSAVERSEVEGPALSAVVRSEVEGIRTKNPSRSSRFHLFFLGRSFEMVKKIAKRSMPKMKRGMWKIALITNQDLTPYP